MLAKQLSGLRAGKLREISAENQITNQKRGSGKIPEPLSYYLAYFVPKILSPASPRPGTM